MGRRRYAHSGTLRIAYECVGAWRRRPWLMLIQGLGFDRYGWGPALPGLRRRYRLILMDNRGSGQSDAAPGSFMVTDMARDVVAVLDAAGVARAHVLGVSLGGMIAQEVAIQHPMRVNRLVLGCTTPGWPFAYPMPAASVALMAVTRRLAPEEARRRHIENALSPTTVAQRTGLVSRLVAYQRAHQGDPMTWHAQVAAGARYSGNLRQNRITAPTLVVHGTADRVVDPRNAELLAKRIPDSTLLRLPDLGHLFFWEDPDAFVSAVGRFLDARRPRAAAGTAAAAPVTAAAFDGGDDMVDNPQEAP